MLCLFTAQEVGSADADRSAGTARCSQGVRVCSECVPSGLSLYGPGRDPYCCCVPLGKTLDKFKVHSVYDERECTYSCSGCRARVSKTHFCVNVTSDHHYSDIFPTATVPFATAIIATAKVLPATYEPLPTTNGPTKTLSCSEGRFGCGCRSLPGHRVPERSWSKALCSCLDTGRA